MVLPGQPAQPVSAAEYSQRAPATQLLTSVRDAAIDDIGQTLYSGQREEIERTLSLLQTGLPRTLDAIPLEWMDRLARETERFQDALRWLGASGEAARGIGLAQALLRFWSARRHRLAAVAQRARQQGSLRRGLAVALEQDLQLARVLCEESLAVVAQIGVRQRRASSFIRLACDAQRRCEHTEAAALFAKGLVLYRQLGDHRGARYCLEQLAALESHVTPSSRASPPSAKTAGSAVSAVSSTSLSPREMEVAALIAQGLTNRQIAKALVIAERTASTHVVHILNKLGVNSRAQVAAWFTREEAQRLPDLARMAKEDVQPVTRRRGRHTFA